MTKFKVKHITIPDSYVIVRMTYEQFKALLDENGEEDIRIYETPDGCLHALQQDRNLIYISEPEKPNTQSR